MIPQGVAFHSASLDWSDRELCERLFRIGSSRDVLDVDAVDGCEPSAFLCVVQGTRQYGSGENREIEGALLQTSRG